jgi:hypothetical protein
MRFQGDNGRMSRERRRSKYHAAKEYFSAADGALSTAGAEGNEAVLRSEGLETDHTETMLMGIVPSWTLT